MSERWLKALNDLGELQALLNADPELTANMAEMGFIRKVPFQMDHNDAVTSKWMLTEAGRNEVLERYINRSKPIVH